MFQRTFLLILPFFIAHLFFFVIGEKSLVEKIEFIESKYSDLINSKKSELKKEFFTQKEILEHFEIEQKKERIRNLKKQIKIACKSVELQAIS